MPLNRTEARPRQLFRLHRLHRMGGLALVGLMALAGAIATATATAASAAPVAPPRLLVALTIDGLPMRQIETLRSRLAPDGLRRFLDRGTVFQQAYYGHAHTVTCAGHATLFSGAHPAVHGLIGNDWIDPQTRRNEYCLGDPAHGVLDTERGTEGTSPRNLLADTLGDSLRRAHPSAKVFGISGKDRGAIPGAGRTGVAYWYQGSTGRMASSSYYLKEHPTWVRAFNARRSADSYAGAHWQPLLSETDCRPCAPDASPWMAQAGFGRQLPAQLGERGPRLYDDLSVTPMGDALLLDFSLELLRQEGLGRDATPDLLAISLSAHDAVGHTFGPESRLSYDHLMHLDRQLQDFFRRLDGQLGAGNWAASLSADHGFLETPEYRRSLGQPGGRLSSTQLLARLNAGLAARLGEGRWVSNVSAGGLLLDNSTLARHGKNADAVAQAAVALLPELDGVIHIHGPAELSGSGGPAVSPVLQSMRKSWHAQRSAPLMFALAEGWLLGSRPMGSTHGSSHPYDQQVPLLFWGPRWVPQGRAVARRVGVEDYAPTLARLLAVPVPMHAQGQVLPEALRMAPH